MKEYLKGDVKMDKEFTKEQENEMESLYKEIVTEVNALTDKKWSEEHVIFWQYGKNKLYHDADGGDEVYYLPKINITVIMNIGSDRDTI